MISAAIFLSLVVALAHLAVLATYAPTGEELGFQHLWHNNSPDRADVAMVWVGA